MPLQSLNQIPLELIQLCGALIKGIHAKQPLDFERIVWDRDTSVLMASIDETNALLASYRSAWRRKTKDENLAAACAAILALEIVGADYRGWGSRYPAAKRQADALLDDCSNKQRLMGIFKFLDPEAEADFGPLFGSAQWPQAPNF